MSIDDFTKSLDLIKSQHINKLNNEIDTVRHAIKDDLEAGKINGIIASVKNTDEITNLLFTNMSELSKDYIKSYHDWLLKHYALKLRE